MVLELVIVGHESCNIPLQLVFLLLLLIILAQELLHLPLVEVLLCLGHLLPLALLLSSSLDPVVLHRGEDPLQSSFLFESHLLLSEAGVPLEWLSEIVVADNHGALDLKSVEPDRLVDSALLV